MPLRAPLPLPSLPALSLPLLSLPLLTLLLALGPLGSSAQDDFSRPIKCYYCEGDAHNSSCADPVDVKNNKDLIKMDCQQGICLKWTFFNKEGQLIIQRVCSVDLNFHLTLINGVCRTERNGNGYLCMCGRNLCNSASRVTSPGAVWLLPLLGCLTLLLQRATAS